MLIGIMSDTHDDLSSTTFALEAMIQRGCIAIIHAGDICSPFVAKAMAGFGTACYAVFGNNDGDRLHLSDIIDIQPAPRHLTIDNREIIVFHEPFINEFIDPTKVSLLIYGHTHTKHKSRVKDMLVVNPGTASGILANKKTFAIYDTSAHKVEFCEI